MDSAPAAAPVFRKSRLLVMERWEEGIDDGRQGPAIHATYDNTSRLFRRWIALACRHSWRAVLRLDRWRTAAETSTVAAVRSRDGLLGSSSASMPDHLHEHVTGADRRTFTLATVSTAAGLVILFVLAPSRFHFWYDSWTYYELAQSIGHRFYAVSTIREFKTNGAFSSAFPPLWPAIVAIFARLGAGVFGSYLASFVSLAAFCATAERLARHLVAQRGVGLLSVLMLVAFPGIRWDLAGGGSFALNLTFIALLGSLFFELDPESDGHAAALGAIAGLMVMLRFDSAPASLVALVAGVALGFRGRRLVVMGAVFALVISPWVVYSWSHFHAPFATDNGEVALALDPDAYVMDYHATVMPMLRDDPAAWVHKLFVHLPIVGLALWDAVLQSVFFIPLWLAVVLAENRRLVSGERAVLRSRPWLALLAVAAAPVAAYVVTGYQESRYFSTFVWTGELVALVLLISALTPGRRRVAVAIICAAGVMKSVSLARYVPQANPLATMRHQISTADTDSLVACLRAAGAQPAEAILFRTNIGVLNGYRFGALSGWRAAPPPRNWMVLTPPQRETFVRKYHISYVLDTLPLGTGRLPSEPVAGCPAAVRRLTSARL